MKMNLEIRKKIENGKNVVVMPCNHLIWATAEFTRQDPNTIRIELKSLIEGLYKLDTYSILSAREYKTYLAADQIMRAVGE